MFAALLAAAALTARAADPAAVTVDLYRSNRYTVEHVRKAAGPALQNYLRQPSPRLLKDLEARVRGGLAVAFFKLSYNEYVTGDERKAYATLDVVDPADAPTRMPFVKPPQGRVPDPDGALAHWHRYAAMGEAEHRKRAVVAVDHPQCPGYYCLWGSPTPELASLEQSFVAASRLRRAELQKALAEDADPRARAAAVYVLSYSTSAATAVGAALTALKDPDEQVRSAGLLVLADVALYHKDAFIDVGGVLPVLDYPSAAERSKALSVLVGLADNPVYRTYLVGRAGPYLLALLRMKQPSNHDLAFTLLATLSGQNHDAGNLEAWSKWVDANTTGTPPVLSGVSVETR